MEGPPDQSRGNASGIGSSDMTNRVIAVLLILYATVLIITAIWGTRYTSFKALYGIWFLLYIGLIYIVISSKILKRLEKINPVWIMVSIFLVTVLLHLPFLLRDPSLSQDILRLERRGDLLLDGKFPYRDFDVNKPPLYIWMVGLVSLPFGADQMVFRIVFTLLSGLVPVAMFLIHQQSGKKGEGSVMGPFGRKIPGMNWMAASFAYALCPIPILETGLGGHFDPVVVLATLIAFYFFMKDKVLFSGIFLGLGFALKLYPMFLAPIFFLSLGKWKDRITFTIAFFTIPFLASLPVLFVDPGLMTEYLRYQFVNWYTGFSIRYGLEMILDSLNLPEKIGYWLLTLILVGGMVYFILRGMVGKLRRSDTVLPMAMMLVLSSMGLIISSIFYFHGVDGPQETGLAIFGTIFSVTLPVIALYLYLHWMPFGKPSMEGLDLTSIFTKTIKKHNVPFIISCVLLLVILTSAQFHPWYIAWILPFSLASGNPYWSWSTLLLFGSFQANSYPPWELGGI